jgi:hypothetical protein
MRSCAKHVMHHDVDGARAGREVVVVEIVIRAHCVPSPVFSAGITESQRGVFWLVRSLGSRPPLVGSFGYLLLVDLQPPVEIKICPGLSLLASGCEVQILLPTRDFPCSFRVG